MCIRDSLWGGFAEYVYVDLGELPGTKIYKLPDDMPFLLGSLSEPLTSCIRAFNRAARAGGFFWGDTVVIQGSGPIGILAVAAALEMGAGRFISVGCASRAGAGSDMAAARCCPFNDRQVVLRRLTSLFPKEDSHHNLTRLALGECSRTSWKRCGTSCDSSHLTAFLQVSQFLIPNTLITASLLFLRLFSAGMTE